MRDHQHRFARWRDHKEVEETKFAVRERIVPMMRCVDCGESAADGHPGDWGKWVWRDSREWKANQWI